MKKAMCIAATAILVLSLAGCAEKVGPVTSESSVAPMVNEETSQELIAAQDSAALFSDSKEVTSAPETEKAAEEPAAETTPDPGTSTEAPREAEKPQETPATQPKATETPQPEKQVNRAAEPTEPQPSEQPKSQETQPPAIPEPDPTPEPTPEQPPAETQPTVQTEPPAAEEPVDPAFCIDDWIAYAQSYAQSMGLRLESSAVDCWDNPITAGAHSLYLERDIQSRLNRYARDEDITDVWIWA